WKSHPELFDEKPLTVAMLGDLRYGRTVHSLLNALSHFNVHFKFISPPSLKMPVQYLDFLKEQNLSFEEHEQIEGCLSDVDVLYATRIQEERFPDPVEYLRMKGAYILKAENLQDVKEGFKVLHPLPRVDEIDVSVDALESAAYFQQAANGIPVRKALLALLLGQI
ncbi:MAG: aspartate carbamoyltransferase, partial [Planctomycetes bacterium]|nr:aspartate carbamoyltransferase [Planctomycetota bacterium]